jgi:hypothetical protein
MLNSAPKQSNKYKQGIFYPKNKDKVVKLNAKGGLFYRSGLEHKMMIYFDNNEKIINWGAEHLRIPYQKTEWVSESQEYKTTEHTYYPDFYYELKREDGTVSKVVAEVKPMSETTEPKMSQNPTAKQMKNFEYALKMYNKNLSKWNYMIEYCNRKGFKFIIITEETLNKIS